MEEHVSPEVIAKLLGETKPEISPPEVKHSQFVVILADDTFPQKAPAQFRRGTLRSKPSAAQSESRRWAASE